MAFASVELLVETGLPVMSHSATEPAYFVVECWLFGSEAEHQYQFEEFEQAVAVAVEAELAAAAAAVVVVAVVVVVE